MTYDREDGTFYVSVGRWRAELRVPSLRVYRKQVHPSQRTTAYPSREDAWASYRRSMPEPMVPTSDNHRSDYDEDTTPSEWPVASGPAYVTREEHNDDLIDTKGMLIGLMLDTHRTLDWTRGLLALTVIALLLVVIRLIP